MATSRTHLAAGAAALLACALTGCQAVDATQQYTQVRFIDASPDAPAVDLYQNAIGTLYNVGFGTISSYISVAPGTYTYTADTANTQQALATSRGTLSLGAQYTVLVGNVAANLQLTVLRDQSTPAPAGQVALRILDQATRAGAVDIYLLGPGGQLATTAPILTNVGFNNTPRYIDVPSGAYSIVVLPTGASTTTTTITTSSTTGTTTTTTTTTTNVPTLYSGNQVTYSGAGARTIILLDQPLTSPPGIQAIVADDYDSPSATS